MNARRTIGQPFAFALVCVLGVPSWVLIPLMLIVSLSHTVVDGWGWFAWWCYGSAGTLSVPFALFSWPFIAVHGKLSDRHLLYAATATGIFQPVALGPYRPWSGHLTIIDLLWVHIAALVCAFLGGTIAIGMARCLGVLPRPAKRAGYDQPDARPEIRYEAAAASVRTPSASNHRVP